MKRHFKRQTALLTAVSALAILSAGATRAQDATAAAPPADDSVVVVRGVRGSQEAAISIKRKSAEIVDSIVATDIGKLPDVTITDSLQRVTGIQISRSAGEGAGVSVRGAPQVLATLNGERFITAENLLSSSVSFNDVPSSMVTGVNVYKSQHAGLTDGGLGGLIDLRTTRALKLKNGLTGGVSAQASYGSFLDGADTRVDATVGYNWDKRFAMSLGVSLNDSTSAGSQQFVDPDLVDEYSTWIANPTQNLNGDSDKTDDYIAPIGWNTNVNSRQYDRKRIGVVYNFNANLADGFELIADVVYNKAEEAQHGQQLFVNGNFGGRGSLPAWAAANPGKAAITGFGVASDQTNRGFYITGLHGLTNGLRAGVQSTYRDTDALNTNLELRYDQGGAFTGSVRWVHADANRSLKNLTVANQTDTRMLVRSLGGTAENINPGSIPTTLSYAYDMRLDDSQMYFNIGSVLAGLASNPAAWYQHSSWLERNETELTMDVLRADGKLDFVDNGFSFEFGARYSKRDMSESRDDYFSPSGIPGLLNKYGEAGYALGQASTPRGTAFGLTYDPLPVYGLDSSTLSPYVSKIDYFGEVGGLNVTLPLVDTRAIGTNPEAWRDLLYGKGKYINAPDRTYQISEQQTSAYFKMNFEAPLSDLVTFSGNLGVRVVNTKLEVTQNVTNPLQLRQDILAGVDPNHTAYVDLGDKVTETDRTVALPSVNLNFDIGSDWRVKAAYTETQALQDLPNLGQGEITYYNGEDTSAGETFQRVSSVNKTGNPKLDPWFARSASLAVEWYPTRDTLVSFGVFNNQIESYTYNAVGTDPTVKDADGVVRRGATTNTISQGEGASYHGFEFGYQQSFKFLPGFWSNTGATFNYTFSPSQGGIDPGTGATLYLNDGSKSPFNNTAENQFNAVVWYQDDKFQARVAVNYLDKTYQGSMAHWSFAPKTTGIGLGTYYAPQTYIDASASYDINDSFQVYIQGSNLTEEAPVRYAGWEDFNVEYNQFERVVTVGVRAKF
ncbi:tonB-dependent receptor family protein [Asticcacaulis biprosthecium C19]|uniref:TonB-dependent receptor family protein n=1 Tax=Asticcacaulis biprosthecium C19 TaxID=715226 RepID=F4QP45_9CAUL|nr:TonB-dependent receptor [Asticcacaulis biprosthecium]EGF91103.1 tonB-dependent receptor family protein [Asticcacaulis biprosthecium C19]